ncbi:S16 family serine protease [Infirmifilum sp. NZ]|uniref:S16 family serine protease n=1 Tax=Infirmifilum sp. NZ TaxID=2926850 RepID=UPI0027A2D73B|nr:S16 family serine protease [Infirmifilum sp. NZ]UNQ73916.1 hypothetical protein MOV14_02595 [Infirmifilum sp. NZ]
MLRETISGVLLALVLLSTLAFTSPAPQQLKVIGSAWVLAPAVSQTDTGYVGSATNISVLVTEGWGDVFVSTYSLTQEDFQGAATAAARVVCNVLGLNFSQYNFYFKVASNAVIIGGPSAGVAMAVAVYSALTGEPVNRSVAVTGMISPDGTVGPVGGVYEKAQAMASSGVKLFLVPPGQSVVTTYKVVVRRIGPFQVYSTQPVTLNLTDYAMRNWGLRVVEVSTIEEALHYFFNAPLKPASQAKPIVTDDVRAKVNSVWSALEKLASDELSAARAYVNASTLTSLTKSALLRYLNAYAGSYLDAARKRRGDAGSIPLLTSSIAESRWVKLVVDYSEGRSLEAQVNSIRDEIATYLSLAEKAGAKDFAQLNFKVLAADLAIRASRLYNASASQWSSDPQSALQSLAYASALLEEAKLWLDGLSQDQSTSAFQQASTYLSIARTTWPYVYSVLSQTGSPSTLLDYASTYYSAATSLFSSGKYFLSAVAAARSIALAEAAMLDFQESASGSTVYVDVSSRRASEIASSAPNLLVSIYFYNQSLTATSDTDKLAYLKLSSELGSLTVELAKTFNATAMPTPGVQETPQPQPTPQPSQPQPRKGIWDRIAEWLNELYVRISLAIEGVVKFLRSLIGK